MSNVMISKSDFTITVKKTGGRITSTGPMTVKNQIEEIRSLDDIPGVNTAQKTDGATIIYNATTGQYDVKSYNVDPYLEVTDFYVKRLHANNSVGSNGQVLFTNGNTAYWANGVTKVTAGLGLTGGGQGEEVIISVNTAYLATITANNTVFAYGKRESDLSVNFSQFAGNSNFSFIANNTTFAFGKTEGTLEVQYAGLAGTANLANLAVLSNNSTFAYGKRESDLSVNFAQFAGNSNFSFIANNTTYAYGKTEGTLNVNSAVYALNVGNTNISVSFANVAANAYFADNSALLDGLDSTYFTNATNIITGTLASERLPNTAVTVGQFGNSTQIPVITVDQYGRINAISTSAVAGVASYNYSSGNNTFSIATGDGSVFRATIDIVKDFAVTGNLTVSGTTTTVNTENLTVKDAVIRLNDGQVTPFNDIGILMQRYAVANSTNYNVAIAWDENTQQLKIGKTPEDGNDNDISFSEEWVRFGDFGNAYILQNIEAGNNVRVGGQLIVNNVTITEVYYPGEANNAVHAFGKTENVLNVNSAVFASNSDFAYIANNSTYAYGKTENVLNVNSAVFATNSDFAYLANNSVHAYGKTENVLNVNSAVFAVNSEFAYIANNSTHAYGKTENVLNVNSAVFATNSDFAYTANNSTYAYGKTENVLNVNSAVYSTNALFSNNALYLNNKPEEYYTNATNIVAGTLAEPRLPFRMDQNVRKADNVEFHDIIITGNVSITGNTTIINSNNISTTDNMFYLNSNNFNLNPDLGFAANYNDGVYRHTGFFRDASDGVWKVFDNYLPEPDASIYIDTANASFHLADFQANTATFAKIVIGSSFITDGAFTGTANNATYAYGKTENVLNVNSAVFATNSQFAYVANNATHAYGKTENVLNVNSAVFATNSNFAYTANNSTYAYGKTENTLSVNAAVYSTFANNADYAYGKTENVLNVNSAIFSTNATFAYTANNATYAYGKTENVLNVNSAVYSTNADFAYVGNNANYLLGYTWAAPGALGIDTANSGSFTSLVSTGPSKIVIQDGLSGTSSRGIFLWEANDPNWGIYMGQSGAGRSLANNTATPGLNGNTNLAVRFRANAVDAGWIWENASEVPLMQLTPDTGDLLIRGTVNATSFLFGTTGVSINSTFYTATANNATYAYGKTENVLNVNSAIFAANADFAYIANNAMLLDGLDSTYFTNATNIDTGTLASERLPTTGVVGGTYGNASAIPVITVDQYGRINTISTSAVAGVTDYQYSSANNTFTIATGDGSVFNATIDIVKDLAITGNLTVSGTTTTVNTENLTVKDAVIRLNDGQVTPFNDIGILMQRYAAANSTNYNVAFVWDENTRQFKFGKTPEDGSDSDISFAQEWVRFDELGNLYTLGNVESSNNIKVTNTLVINNVTITELSYPGTANNATYAYGKTENVLNVNSAVFATNSQFAYTANNSTYAFGKTENVLNVNSAVFATNSQFAYVANNSTYAYGKTENVLNVNSAVYAVNSEFAYTGNNANYLLGYTWTTPGAIGTSTANSGSFTSLTASGVLTGSGGSKISVQGGVDGTSARGIYLWTSTDPNWGIYMSQSGAGKSLANGAATPGLDGATDWAVRNRAGSINAGWIWENEYEQAMMQLTPDTGNLLLRGSVNATSFTFGTTSAVVNSTIFTGEANTAQYFNGVIDEGEF